MYLSQYRQPIVTMNSFIFLTSSSRKSLFPISIGQIIKPGAKINTPKFPSRVHLSDSEIRRLRRNKTKWYDTRLCFILALSEL